MRESLICIGKIGEKGYYFEDTGIQIFSYEELCYYMSQHMICYIHTLPGEDLLAYIRDELDLDKLSKQLSKLLDPEKDLAKALRDVDRSHAVGFPLFAFNANHALQVVFVRHRQM